MTGAPMCSLGYNRIMIKDCKGIYYEPDGTDPGRGNVGVSRTESLLGWGHLS